MPLIFKNIIRFCVFFGVQVFILDHIMIHQMVVPYLYFLFILWLPFSINRSVLMVVAFLTGLSLDYFHHSGGFHAAACVLIAYIRPFLINILIPREGADNNYFEPSTQSFGGIFQYMIYAGLLALIHNAWLFLLQAWQFGNPGHFFVKTLLSTALSLLLILTAELIFPRKQKFRTNTI
ncbi:MAG: rod shape-determining protein MreD [Bacteroidetes bacterium]|nr:rod shape-determining protein MreD [Bacteroidota bacterium]